MSTPISAAAASSRESARIDTGQFGAQLRAEDTGFTLPSQNNSGNGTHSYCGSDKDRQSVGLPGHCEDCATLGHVQAHPDLGCGDVQCTGSHPEPVPVASRVRPMDDRANEVLARIHARNHREEFADFPPWEADGFGEQVRHLAATIGPANSACGDGYGFSMDRTIILDGVDDDDIAAGPENYVFRIDATNSNDEAVTVSSAPTDLYDEMYATCHTRGVDSAQAAAQALLKVRDRMVAKAREANLGPGTADPQLLSKMEPFTTLEELDYMAQGSMGAEGDGMLDVFEDDIDREAGAVSIEFDGGTRWSFPKAHVQEFIDGGRIDMIAAGMKLNSKPRR